MLLKKNWGRISMNLCTHRSDDSIRITAIRILLPTLASLWLVACSGGSGEGSIGSGGDSSGPDGGGAVGQSLTVTITAPESGTTWPAADMVQFAGEAEDPEDGPLAGNALVWKSDRDGDLGTGTNVTVDTLSPGGHNVTLTATASDGASATDTIFVWVSEPPGAADKRAGEFNPYAPHIKRLPFWRDDELVTIRNVAANASLEFGMIAKPVAAGGTRRYAIGVGGPVERLEKKEKAIARELAACVRAFERTTRR